MACDRNLNFQLLPWHTATGRSKVGRSSSKDKLRADGKAEKNRKTLDRPHPRKRSFVRAISCYGGVSAFAMLAAVSGCATPYSQLPTYDPKVSEVPAGIMLSDPKVFSRQALVRERQEDVVWIDGLIKDSKDSVFGPELLREVEQISSFALALGLKVDPALGLNNRRDRETGDIQQQIDVLKLKFGLEQLQQDLELFRKAREAKTEPVNTGLGVVPTGSTPDAGGVPDAAAADQLKAAIDRLTTALTNRLDGESKATRSSSAAVNPADLFRDRAAYRDLLRSARNAASLDEGHDIDGSTLLRLNFQATVLPDPAHVRSLGAIQVRPKQVSAASNQAFVLEWLEFLNQEKDDAVRSEVNLLINLGVLQRVDFSTGIDAACGAIVASPKMLPPKCKLETLVLPVFVDGAGKSVDIVNEARSSQPFTSSDDRVVQMPFELIRQTLSQGSFDHVAACAAINGNYDRVRADQLGWVSILQGDLIYAGNLRRQSDRLKVVTKVAQAAGYIRSPAWDISARVLDAQRFSLDVQKALPDCAKRVGELSGLEQSAEVVRYSIVESAARSNASDKRIRVYNIGPREQVQQISTVARAAESLAFAAQLAASKPSSGAALQAASSFSRQAIGRAEMRERVPSVVGYAVAADESSASSAFGWVIGPQAQIDSGRGKVRISQPLRTYDLSVDLSVPSFDDFVELEVATIWGPSPTGLVNRTWTESPKTIKVPLPRVTNDFRRFNRSLLGRNAGSEINLNDGEIAACRETVILATGPDQLWRTSEVAVGNQLLGPENIRVLPDMNGVSIRVPKMPDLRPGRVSMTLLGPQRQFTGTVAYAEKPSGGCDGKAAAAATTQSGPKILALEPADATFLIPGEIQLRVNGTGLQVIDGVEFRTWPGTIVNKAADGTRLTARFPEAATATARTSDAELVKFLAKDKQVEQTSIRIIRKD